MLTIFVEIMIKDYTKLISGSTLILIANVQFIYPTYIFK